MEAEGSGVSRENRGRSGSTRWTRAAWMRSIGLDGAGQFAFQSAEMIDVLDEAGGAEGVGLVKDLVADATAFGQAAFGELHAEPGDLVLRHHDDGAVVLHLVGDALAFEILDDRRGVFVAQISEEGHHGRRRDAHDDEAEEADESQRHGAHRCHACCAQTFQKFQIDLARLSPPQDLAPRATGQNLPRYGFHMVNGG